MKRFMRHQLRKSLYSKTSLTCAQQHISTAKQPNVEVTKRLQRAKSHKQGSELVKKAQYHGYRRTADRTTVRHGGNGVCTWRSEACRVSARDQRHFRAWFQQAHLAGVRGRSILLRR